jgi:peptidyl-prolyl cis-trans isomerase D
MLQQIRDKITGWFAMLLLGAIAIVFIFWGIETTSTVNTFAAKVNGEKVPLEQVRRAWQDRQTELQRVTRDELPEELVKSEQERLLEDFIRRELLTQRAAELGFRVSDRALAESVAALPALQVDGKFSRDRYAALLRAQGRSETDFEADFRRELEVNQLRNSMAMSAFALPGELRRRVELEGETRDVDLAIVPAAAFAAAASVTPEAIEAWYRDNEASYRTPETVALQYVELTLPEVAASVTVTDEALQQYYDQVAPERYVSAERRRARHILVESGTDDAAALAKAEKLAERARAGEDFATLAAQNSDDPGSKGQGGDLGWATRESFVAPFAEALFGMAKDEIRGPVKTQFGYHVLRLEEVEAAHQRSFEEVRAELEADYRQDQAQSLFYERSQQLADEAFASLSELESVAQKLGLELRTVEGFTRQGGGRFGAERKIIDAAFSDEVLQERQNSPAVSVGEQSVVVLRVTDHQPPVQRPLEEVRAQVEASVRGQAASRAAEAAAKSAATQLAAGRPWAEVASELGVQPPARVTVTRSAETLPPDLSKAIFAAARPAEGQATSGTAMLSSGDAAVFLVSAVRPGSLPAADGGAAFAENVQRAAAGAALAEFAAYVLELERTAKVVRNPKAFE